MVNGPGFLPGASFIIFIGNTIKMNQLDQIVQITQLLGAGVVFFLGAFVITSDIISRLRNRK